MSNGQGVAVVQIDSPAYQTRLALRNAAPPRGLADSEWNEPFMRSSTSPTWLPCALTTENAIRAPSELAKGRTHMVPPLTVVTPPAPLHAWMPAVVRKYSFAPAPAHAA